MSTSSDSEGLCEGCGRELHPVFGGGWKCDNRDCPKFDQLVHPHDAAPEES